MKDVKREKKKKMEVDFQRNSHAIHRWIDNSNSLKELLMDKKKMMETYQTDTYHLL